MTIKVKQIRENETKVSDMDIYVNRITPYNMRTYNKWMMLFNGYLNIFC